MLLFNHKGYRDTSMEDIAAAVGIPASGIYRYFSGKSDILRRHFGGRPIGYPRSCRRS